MKNVGSRNSCTVVRVGVFDGLANGCYGLPKEQIVEVLVCGRRS